MRNEEKLKSYKDGLKAEKIAKLWLRLKGYEIIAQRVKTSFGEIDIVAKKKNIVVIVEVKARPTLRECIEAVTPSQQARIIRAANSLTAFPGEMARYFNGLQTNLRFDLLAIRPRSFPHHIKDAWRPA